MKTSAGQGLSAATPLVTASFPGTHDQASHARALVRDALHEARYDGITRDAELLTSELFTNAVQHSRSGHLGTVTVMIQAGDVVRIEVVDDGSAISCPRVMTQDAVSLGGRGLFLVQSISSRFGMRSDHAATAIWFELVP
ncbi:ATP-binding protein [Sphaerisporangium sp. NPDC088356]|uniref:ATP-binding protein n=1 Tax=Sphaerisporangium sp. NPDC088356 TaxID=3154871 RepID=UPI00343CD101